MMDKCSLTEMSKNLAVVAAYIKAGIDFVPVPVKSRDHKTEMINYANEVLEEIIIESNDK